MTTSPVSSLADKFIRTTTPVESKSVGAYVGKIGKFGHHCWEAKTSIKSLFKSQIRSEILQYLEGRFDSISTQDFITVTLYMIGRRSSTAAPTVLFVSENEGNRKSARKLIKECGILTQYRGWKTAQTSQDPSWGARLEQLASGMEPYQDEQSKDPATHVLYDPSQPITSQGQPLYISHASDLRTATANLIRLHGKAFYLMPAHAFFEKPDEPEPTPDSFDDDFEIDSDDETDTILAKDNDEDVDDTTGELGVDDIDGWSSSDQSSISDTISTEESDEETYSQSSFGSFGVRNTLYASSPYETPDSAALRTTSSKPRYPARELQKPIRSSLLPFGVLSQWSVDRDWALVEVVAENDPTLSAFLDIHTEDLSTMPVASHGIAGATIVTRTTSSGRLTGTMSSTPSDTRLPGGSSFQEVFSVRLDGPLADGDCGSSVVDATTGELYGHIVAGCRETGFAYVMPASHVQLDLQKATTTSVTARSTVGKASNSSCGARRFTMESSRVRSDGIPLKLACLDGGGIRGLSSLWILQLLLQEIAHSEQQVQVGEGRIPGTHRGGFDGNELLPSHYFDYMSGTSTGGLIAVMLGRLRMTVSECQEVAQHMYSKHHYSRYDDPYQSRSPDSGGLYPYSLPTAAALAEELSRLYTRKDGPLTDWPWELYQVGHTLRQPSKGLKVRTNALPSWSWKNEVLEEAVRKDFSSLDEVNPRSDEKRGHNAYQDIGAPISAATLGMNVQAIISLAIEMQSSRAKLLKAAEDMRSISQRLFEAAEIFRTALECLESSSVNGTNLEWRASTDRSCEWVEASHTDKYWRPELTAANLSILQDMHEACIQEPTPLVDDPHGIVPDRHFDISQPRLEWWRPQHFSRDAGYSRLSRNSRPEVSSRSRSHDLSTPTMSRTRR